MHGHVYKRGALVKEISQADADAYNSVQRGHQNAVESMPQAIGLMIMGSFGFPVSKPAQICIRAVCECVRVLVPMLVPM